MVPKTNQSSSKGQGESSSAEDLYNKTHEFVLSRTPDQSHTSVFLQHSMRSAVAAISQEIGWNSAHLSTIDLLSDLTARYLMQIAKQTKKYAEHCGRTLVCEEDIVLGLRDMNVSISELEEYIQNFDPVPTQQKEMPYFPVPRKTDLNFLRHGSDEMLTRPLHVHEYMPPMIFEKPEESEKDQENEDINGDVEEQISGAEEVRIKSEPSDDVQFTDDGEQSSSQMQGEVMTMPFVLEEPSQVPDVGSELVVTESQPILITEEVEIKTENIFEPESDAAMPMDVDEHMEIEQAVPENEEKENEMEEESSDDEIEPGLKGATMFALFKSTKKLGPRTENAAIKRKRKMIEEHGHPVREVSSVIMTKDGFLSESRLPCLPECKPPPNTDFFDTSPVPADKRRKPPTMKKILEGVKKLERSGEHSDSGGEDEPGLFGVMDKIKITNVTGGVDGVIIPEAIGAAAGLPGEISKKKLSKQERQERKLLHQKKKEKKLKIKAKSKEKQLLKKAKLQKQTSDSKELDPSGSKNKLMIFTKKLKGTKLDPSGGSTSKKKKKDKKNKSKPKEVKLALSRIDERNPDPISVAPTNTEMIDSDEDFSNIPEGRVPPMHIMNPAIVAAEDEMPMIPKKKLKKFGKLKPQMFDLALQKQPMKKFLKINKKLAIPPMGLASLKTKLPNLKRPFEAVGEDTDGIPMKKKRGRPPKKIWGEAPGAPNIPGTSVGLSPVGGPMSLPAAQLADIGKSLMMKEPQLNVMKIRKEHMEIQDVVQRPPMFSTKPPTLSPSKGMLPSLVNADLLKRLPAQPGLIPDHLPVPPVRLPKDLSSSISVSPSLSSPQKEHAAMASSSSPRNLASNMCSSVTITRIEMTPQKLPSRYDDAVTPGIGPPPGMEQQQSPIKRSKFGKPPPLLQIPVHTETESGITITPIVMGGGGGGPAAAHAGGNNKEHRYDHPLPPPPPLQERPQKHSMLAKLDEELSSTTAVPSSLSKDQRKKDKEKRKELRKEKKKKAKDKSKDKSEKKKKKKDKSGESTSATSDAGELSVPITVPKLTLKLGSHSTTTTPVDSPNPPQIYHEPPMPGPAPPPKKLTIRGLNQEQEPTTPKPKPKMPSLTFAPPRQEEEVVQVARFAPLVTRPQKPARAAKAHAAAAVAAMGMGASVMSHQDIVQFPSMRDSGGNRTRGRGRPPKGNAPAPLPAPVIEKVAVPSSSKQAKSSLTVLETETVGCIIDDQGNKVWICPACGRQDDGSPMIGCDICDDWYHFVCVGITQEPKEEDQWYCQRCKKKQKEGKGKKGRK